MVKMIDKAQLEELREEFQKIDTDDSGTISLKELQESLKNSDIKISKKEIKHIIEELRYYDYKEIKYSEFLAATINP